MWEMPSGILSMPALSLGLSLAVVAFGAQGEQLRPARARSTETFVGADLGVALEYPSDWAVRREGPLVIFTPPQGPAIRLAPRATGDLSPGNFLRKHLLPNTRCSWTTNAHRVKARRCFDTLSFSHSADLVVRSPGGDERLISLSVDQGGDLQAFDAIVASVRPAS